MGRTGYDIEHDLTRGEPRAIFVFHGRGETSFGPELRQEVGHLLDSGFRVFDMDLRAVESCDSVSLGTFVGLQAAIRRVHGTLVFTLRAHTHLRELFSMLKLDRVLTVREVQTSQRTPLPTIRKPPTSGTIPADASSRRPRWGAPETTEDLMFEPGMPSDEERTRRTPGDEEA
jgi:anti-anti-sigma regulatory factor